MQPNYRPALEIARRRLRDLDPQLVAERCGAEVASAEAGIDLRLRLLGRHYRVPLPEALVYDVASGMAGGVSTTLILLHYLVTASGARARRQWIPFRSLPGGGIYDQAFRQQCLDPLVEAFGRDPEALSASARALGGERDSMGDISFRFLALPHLPMACVLWLPDEEQGAEASLLFDAVAPSCLPTEDLAALGRALAFGLIRARGEQP